MDDLTGYLRGNLDGLADVEARMRAAVRNALGVTGAEIFSGLAFE